MRDSIFKRGRQQPSEPRVPGPDDLVALRLTEEGTLAPFPMTEMGDANQPGDRRRASDGR